MEHNDQNYAEVERFCHRNLIFKFYDIEYLKDAAEKQILKEKILITLILGISNIFFFQKMMKIKIKTNII